MTKSTSMERLVALAVLATTVLFAGAASAQPAGWCTAGAKLEVFWVSSWYHATVKGPASGGRCQIGYDGWASSWDEAITMDRSAAAGTKISTSPRPGAAVAAVQQAPAGTRSGTPPKLGLYTCTEPSGYPDMTSMFAILDANSYSTAEKARGHYKFDAQTDMITMDTGPLAGKSYRRIPGTHAFLMQHRPMALSCPYSPRNPLHYPW